MATTYGSWRQENDEILGFPPAAIAGAAALGVLMIPITTHSWAALAVAGPIALLLLLSVVIRVEGRAALSWIGVAGRWLIVEQMVGTTFAGSAGGRLEDGDGAELRQREDWELPGVLHPLRHLAARDDGGAVVAVLHYPPTGLYTMVAQVRQTGTALLDTEDLDRRVAGWGNFMASECEEDGLARISVYEHIERGEGSSLARWVEDHIAPGVRQDAADVVRQVVRGQGAVQTSRRTWITIGVAESRARREIRGFGGGEEGARRVLTRRARAVAARLGTIGLELDHWLSPPEMFDVLRQCYDPDARVEQDRAPMPTEARDSGPNVTKARFGSYLHDGFQSVTWELGWPNSPRQATLLAGLTGGDGVSRRAIALHVEPVPRHRAQREIGAARVQGEIKREVSRKAGRIERAAAKRARAVAEGQDAALASGAGIVRFSGFVTVTVPEHAEMDAAVAAIRNDAGVGGIRLARCAGWMDSAFAVGVVPIGCLPVGKRKVLV